MDNTILVAIEEPLIVKGLKFSLEQDGHTVDTSYSEEDTLQKVSLNRYVLVIMDIAADDIKGLSVYQKVREKSNTPIIVLTQDAHELDKTIGIESGAYDYLIKPINIMEFKSKVNAALMKAKGKKSINSSIIKLWDLTIDTFSKRLFSGNREIELTAKEFDILVLLAQNKNKVYSRENLLEAVWGFEHSGDKRIVDVHIRRLREKLETDPSNPLYIMTKWGSGYYFNG